MRKHLAGAREQHRRARYPGDLGSELLAPKVSIKALVAQAGILAAAVAAVVLLALRLSRAPVEIEADPAPLAAVEPDRGVALVFPALGLPQAPAELRSIATPSLSFAAPGFPSAQFNFGSISTTKESI